jgi:hypothetical protein
MSACLRIHVGDLCISWLGAHSGDPELASYTSKRGDWAVAKSGMECQGRQILSFEPCVCRRRGLAFRCHSEAPISTVSSRVCSSDVLLLVFNPLRTGCNC